MSPHNLTNLSMSNIYEISRELETFLAALPDTGELSDEDMATYSELLEEKDNKIKSTAYAYLNLKAKLEGIKTEIDRIGKLKKSVELHMGRIEKLITFGMELENADNKDFGDLKVYFTRSVGTVVDDQEAVPEEYIKSKVVTSVDLTAAKEAIKNGETISGIHLEERRNLQIK